MTLSAPASQYIGTTDRQKSVSRNLWFCTQTLGRKEVRKEGQTDSWAGPAGRFISQAKCSSFSTHLKIPIKFNPAGFHCDFQHLNSCSACGETSTTFPSRQGGLVKGGRDRRRPLMKGRHNGRSTKNKRNETGAAGQSL